MADDYGDGFNPVDQGSVLMLCLSVGLAVLAAIWFGCRWYKKKYSTIKPRLPRRRLKQTFSRFSQVDEELTMHHISDQDADILQRYSVLEPTTSVGYVGPHSSPATQQRSTITGHVGPHSSPATQQRSTITGHVLTHSSPATQQRATITGHVGPHLSPATQQRATITGHAGPHLSSATQQGATTPENKKPYLETDI